MNLLPGTHDVKTRIVFECYESSPETQQILSKTVMMSGSIDKPEDVFNFGFAHEDKIKLVHSCPDALLKEQITLIESVVECCPHCPDRKLRESMEKDCPITMIFLRIISYDS